MKIIISPAKRMVEETDIFECESIPFLTKTKALRDYLKSQDYDTLKRIWACNDDIVKENIERLNTYSLDSLGTPSIFAYDGIQYKNMAPRIFEEASFNYLNDHLFILSAMYGALKPMEGVIPYRLEMQAKINFEGHKTLYSYWGEDIYNRVFKNNHVLVNLASLEYFDAIKPYLKEDDVVITCAFCNKVKDKLVQRSTASKSCRGAMVKYMCENQIEDLNLLKNFEYLGFKYSEKDSDEFNFVFVKE